ncbi:MAG: SGNH/GDSL hydrolase family protein [Lachnospiraceae bacterium]|nr:SGNH/GDSL hydrolase family protein [Lachnospiraceae bacterium]
MKLTNGELKKFYFGAYSFEETEDGYLQAFQYTHEQMEYFKNKDQFFYDRCMASTAKTLEFAVGKCTISFDYRILWKGSDDTFELYADGKAVKVYEVKDLAEEGRLTFEVPEGTKNAVIYLPADATVLIRDFEMDAEAQPPVKGEKVLWLGDSITQGYGPLRSGSTYVSVANRHLNYDIINQGIGGYVYDKGSLMEMPGYHPDKIIVSLGTNQFGSETMDDVEEYYVRLTEIYGRTIPILTILPIWREDVPNCEETLRKYCEGIRRVCEQYDNIRIVDGFELVPHLSELFLDGLHPNVQGAACYGSGLVKEIERLGF